MARKARVELEGGLYHVITRGNNRQTIFKTPDDYTKFLSLIKIQKDRLPFFLYAYCLMSNHVHLLIERQADAIGRIMHRVLTGYSQYYNRRYRKVGHVLQGRHNAILCQTDRYLSELVRYIHLNPVRAKMVSRPEQYLYSSHRAYLGQETRGLVDVDPVLRHFGTKKAVAQEGSASSWRPVRSLAIKRNSIKPMREESWAQRNSWTRQFIVSAKPDERPSVVADRAPSGMKD